MTGFAFTQFGTIAGPVGSTPTTFMSIPPGDYGKNAAVIVAMTGAGIALGFFGAKISLSGAGVPLGSFTITNPPEGYVGTNQSAIIQPFIPADNPPTTVNPLDSGVDVKVTNVTSAGAIYFVGVLSWAAGPDARSRIVGNWVPLASNPPTASAWNVAGSHSTGTIRSLPSSSHIVDPLVSDPSLPIAVGFYLGRAASSSPSIPTFAADPLLPGWSDIVHFSSGQRVISVGQWTQSLAGLDNLGRVNGNFDVANMPGLAASDDAWGIIYCPVGQGVVLGGRSWVAVIG